ERRQERQTGSDDGWLRVDCLAQRLLRPREAQLRERETHRRVSDCKDSAGGRRDAEDIRPHTDRLTALPGKYKHESRAHTILRWGIWPLLRSAPSASRARYAVRLLRRWALRLGLDYLPAAVRAAVGADMM